MAYNSQGLWSMEDDSVSAGVTRLTGQNTPLMQQAKTQAKQASQSRGLLNSSMAIQAGQVAAYNAALPIASQEAQQTHAKNVAQMDINSAQTIQDKDISAKQGLMDSDVQSKEKIASMNVAANDREKALSGIAAMENTYSEMFKNIAANHNLPADVRDQYIAHMGRLRDSSLAMVEQMYGIDLDWDMTGAAA